MKKEYLTLNKIFSHPQFNPYYLVTITGVASICTQFIIIRELLNIFTGNELVISVFLANWLLLSAIGSYSGRFWQKIKVNDFFILVIFSIIMILPFLQILLIRYSSKIFFLPGLEQSFLTALFFSLLLLSPYCLLHGLLFPLYCRIFENQKNKVSFLYLFDNAGDLLGGLVFSFILAVYCSNMQSILLPTLLILQAVVLYNFKIKHAVLFIISLICVLCLFVILLVPLNKIDKHMLSWQYPGQELIDVRETRYSRLAVTKLRDQYNLYDNKGLLFHTDNQLTNEETIHFAAVQLDSINRVLLIGGGAGGTINELQKYEPKIIDYLEIDPGIIDLAKQYLNFKALENVKIINQDGRFFLTKTINKYDLIIIDLSDPDNIQLNRFYTRNFFSLVNKRITENGVFSLSLSASENFLSAEMIKSSSSLIKTLKDIFKYVLVIPGENHIFLASNKEMTLEIAERIQEKKITTEFINQYYLISRLSSYRLKALNSQLINNVTLNTDFNPFVFFVLLKKWTIEFGKIQSWLYYSLALLFLIIFFRQNRISIIIFSSGFSVSVLEIMILIGFQMAVGYIYYALSILITIFMLGLATGTAINICLKKTQKKHLILSEIFIILLAGIIAIFAVRQNSVESVLTFYSVYFSLIYLIAVMLGFQFSLCAKILEKTKQNTIVRNGARLYFADLSGSYFGILLGAVVFFPLLGFVNVIYLVLAVKVLSLIYCAVLNLSG